MLERLAGNTALKSELGAALGAIPDHGNGLAVQCAEISGVVMNNIHCYSFFK